MARQFATARPTGLVITKIDETSTPAGIVHASISSKLPVSTICFGQRVPEDIAPATVPALVDFLTQCADRGSK
jgi:flagellar biosynthesis protein FlhF